MVLRAVALSEEAGGNARSYTANVADEPEVEALFRDVATEGEP